MVCLHIMYEKMNSNPQYNTTTILSAPIFIFFPCTIEIMQYAVTKQMKQKT